MNLIVQIPDDLVDRLAQDGIDLSRQALEALAAEAYRAGRLTKPELRRILGFETRIPLDGFFKAHNIDESITADKLRQQLRDLDRLKV